MSFTTVEGFSFLQMHFRTTPPSSLSIYLLSQTSLLHSLLDKYIK